MLVHLKNYFEHVVHIPVDHGSKGFYCLLDYFVKWFYLYWFGFRFIFPVEEFTICPFTSWSIFTRDCMPLSTCPFVLTRFLTIFIWMHFGTQVLVFTKSSIKMFTFFNVNLMSGCTSELQYWFDPFRKGLYQISMLFRFRFKVINIKLVNWVCLLYKIWPCVQQKQ